MLKTGRFGPYVEMSLDGQDKPKRASLPKGWTPQNTDLEQALLLLSLPRAVGLHPEDGEPILANIGRYGPYIQHLKTYANLQSIDEVFDVGLNRAVTLIAEKIANGGRRGSAAKVLLDLGKHPGDDGPVQLLEGRYGPYIKHGKINATLPKTMTADDLNMDIALELLAEKEKKGTRKKPAARKKATTAKTTKKPAAKKPAAKKKAKPAGTT